MAEVTISVSDEASARQWLSKVMLINEQYHQAMTEAGETLQETQNFAEGTMVDEFVDLGSKILTAAKNTFEAINSIADTVNTAISLFSGFTETAVGVISKVASIFGA